MLACLRAALREAELKKMKKYKFNYWLDYGTCLWCADGYTRASFKGHCVLDKLPLSTETKTEVKAFLKQ